MDDGEQKCKNILKDLHFKAVNTRSDVINEEKKDLLKRPKFTVVPAQLPTSASQCDTGDNTTSSNNTHGKGLSTCATSPASIGLPAVITPTRPSMCPYSPLKTKLLPTFKRTFLDCYRILSG